MKKPWLKKILSYFYDVDIARFKSNEHPDLSLILANGRYQLIAGDAIYSYEDKYDNFKVVFEALNVSADKEERHVLLLGLGLGAIPFMLENVFNCNYKYTAVELDPVIAKIAKEYCLNTLKSNVELIIQDAYDFMEANQTSYDMICMDVFIETDIPADFRKKDFLNLLKQALNQDGILIYNTLYDTKTKQKESNLLFDKFVELFDNPISLETEENRMLLSKMAL